jgi:hypothetical protein
MRVARAHSREAREIHVNSGGIHDARADSASRAVVAMEESPPFLALSPT